MESDWKFHHLGAVVRDVDEAVEYYQSLGIAATSQPGKTMEGKKLKVKLRSTYTDSLQIEFVQPVEGESIQSDFLNSRGEGVNHICFSVDDLDKERAKLVERGIPVLFAAKFPTGGGFAYFDTRKVGNILIELIQPEK